jgi:hypothetical protein
MLDLSGSSAATSSIFLNCQGNRDGYRNGRISKPTKKKIQFQTRCEAPNNNIRLSSGLYASYVHHQTVRKEKSKKKTCHVQHGTTV